MKFCAAVFITLGCIAAMTGCGGSSSGYGSVPPAASPGTARVRFAEGAPVLEAIINGVPQDIGTAYLRVNGETLNSAFGYGTLTQFINLPAGAASLSALDDLGYRVGPVKTAALSAGKRYTVVLVGNYPNYSALTFEEPASASTARLSLYEASPAVPKADFGSFRASTHSQFKRLGSAAFGNVATAALGSRVSNVGGYAGNGIDPFANGTATPVQIDSFDRGNALPFHNASRLSLFLFDVKPGSSQGPVFGSLDR